jgi:oligoendopeptidase F
MSTDPYGEGSTVERLPSRAKVPVEQTWNLADLCPAPEAFEAGLATIEGDAQEMRTFKGRLSEGAKTLLACLEADSAIRERAGRLSSYAFLNLSTDGLSPVNQAAHGRTMSVESVVLAESAFMSAELLALPAGTIERYLVEESALAPWQRWLKRIIALRAHQLTAETEQAVAALREVLMFPGQIYQRWRVADLAFRTVRDGAGVEHPMSFAGYERVYERSSDTTLRRNAYTTFTECLSAYKNTVAAVWDTQVKENVALARLRGYGSAIEMNMAEQDVPLDLFNRLHDVILTELAPHMRKLAELRKRVLGLGKVLYCDIEAELDPEFKPVSTFDQAREMIVNGLSVLGDEYSSIIKAAFRDRWIDWANNEGKTKDCFSGGPGNMHPYVLIGWDGSMRSMVVLAHELGHAVHQYLSGHYQKSYSRGAPLLLSEAASTASEAIFGRWLIDHSDSPRMRRWAIMQLLISYYHNFVRHLIESELQRRLYPVSEAGRPITAGLLCEVQGDILAEFWGDAVAVDDGARLTWMRQGHYYSESLYSYSYSGGLTVGTAIALAIQREGAPAAERWVSTLKAGGSLSPLDLAKLAGVDLSKPDPIRDAVAYVAELIEELVRRF